MPSLILTDAGPGYPLVQGSQSIVALGNVGGSVDSRITETSDVRITEDGNTRVPE